MKPAHQKSDHCGATYVGNLAVWLGVVCVLVPFLLASHPANDADYLARRREIESMSGGERADLERRFHAYQRATPEERARYDAIDRAIRDEPELMATLDAYDGWLKSLSPYQREELRKESDTTARVKLVQDYRRQQLIARGLTAEDFDAVMQVIAKRLPFSEEERQSLKSMTGIRRHLLMIQKAFKIAREKLSAGNGPPWPRWPRDELMDEMIQVISSTPIREFIQSDDMEFRRGPMAESGDSERSTPKDKSRRKLVGLMMQRLQIEWQEEIARHQPTEEQLGQFLAELPPETRIDLLRRPRDEAHHELLMRYFAKNGTASGRFPIGDVDLRTIMGQLQPWRTMRGGVGPRGAFPDRRRMPHEDGDGQRSPQGDRPRAEMQHRGPLPRFGSPRDGRRPGESFSPRK